MDIRAQAVRSFRLRAHHLDKMLPSGQIETAAGACGVQNSPPGAWETALFNRVEGCTLPELHDALYRRKTLLQAWSYRGVPVVFPTAESGIFLSPLAALEGEAPWIYTRGIALALEHLQMSFDSLLPLVKQAAGYLDAHTVQGKETLDRVLADAVRERLPSEKRTLWDSPSMYGAPDRQTVGGAAVSFLLRPCSFSGLVVFGCRRGGSPTFASFRSWLGRAPETPPDADRLLVRKFLHCHGPSTPALLAEWLGARPHRRGGWNSVAQGWSRFCGGQSALVPFCRPRCAGPSLRPAGRLLCSGRTTYLDTRDRDAAARQSA
ncbi:MAG: DNA glycosylase AlkZ-like family protein [Ruthenibacterium lactatiformans]